MNFLPTLTYSETTNIKCNVLLLQCTLHSNGDIVFVYVTVPDLLSADALYDDEPVAGKMISYSEIFSPTQD